MDHLTLVEQVLSIPTMSFHEEGIATFVKWYAAGIGLTVREDKFGNLLITEGKGSGEITFTAHMDHPGFEVVSSNGNRSTVALWGKVDPKMFEGSKVVSYSAEGEQRLKIGRRIKGKKHKGRAVFNLNSKRPLAKGDFGHFDLPHMKLSGKKIFTRAADNLISVAAILQMFTLFRRKRFRSKAAGLFTRGEEAGFLGAFAAMETGLISKRNPLIVLECSSASHAKVEIGKGPVIRVGDWQSSYDPTVDRWMSDVAEKMLKKSKGDFAFQRELLPGGRCEACVYIANGYKTGGIAMPLGNYHNHGAGGRPAAEFVSVADYERMVALMCELAKQKKPSVKYLRDGVETIRKNYQKMRRKLVDTR